jgi:hypothetical protein
MAKLLGWLAGGTLSEIGFCGGFYARAIML